MQLQSVILVTSTVSGLNLKADADCGLSAIVALCIGNPTAKLRIRVGTGVYFYPFSPSWHLKAILGTQNEAPFISCIL